MSLEEYRSTIERSAKRNVPIIKPSWTVEVIHPKVESGKCHSLWISAITAFPANHKEAPENCEMMMIGRIRLGGSISNQDP